MAFQTSKTTTNPSLVEPHPGLTKEDKWKAVSHLQKCIRRGWVGEVEDAVRLCYQLDTAYTRYRLSVIAFEDIAGGNPSLVAQSFKEGWTKKVIEAQGGVEWLVDQAKQWAAGPKDRLASDLYSALNYKEEFEAVYGSFEALSIDHALDLAWRDIHWSHRALALWRALGTEQYPHSTLPKIAGDLEKVIQKNQEMGIPEAFSDCVRAGVSQRESAPIFLPLVAWGLQQETPTPFFLSSEKNTPIWVGPWVSIALDKHTREGQKALSWAWYRTDWKRQFEALGVSQETALDAIGQMQFWMEGGLLDQTQEYSLKKVVRIESRRRIFEALPFSAKQLYDIAGQEEVWHKARAAVLGTTWGPRSPLRKPTL